MSEPDKTPCPKGEMGRRQFVKGAALAGATTITTAAGAYAQVTAPPPKDEPRPQVPRKALGRTGLQVSALGVGGFHLGVPRDPGEATRIVARALEAGINFFDNAWE